MSYDTLCGLGRDADFMSGQIFWVDIFDVITTSAAQAGAGRMCRAAQQLDLSGTGWKWFLFIDGPVDKTKL